LEKVNFQPEVAAALSDGRAAVGLESSVLAQGLPDPSNREADRRMCAAIRARGAVPAITAIVRGAVCAGLDGADLERFLSRAGIPKVSARDLPWAIARGTDGATTVAAAVCICARAGIDVFATGGIGGVHRTVPGAPLDESADLLELSRSSVVTVCAGAKSILDLPATVERLETLGVTVIGFRTNEFPGFFTARTGLPLSAVADSPREIAAAFRASRALGRPGALLVVQPPPAAAALDPAMVDDAVTKALAAATAAGISGARVTPFLLAEVERATGGRSLAANIALLEANAALAAEIAVALADSRL
jgi:pseudouridylate synthase